MRLLTRFRPSPAMVVAVLALLVALGGTSYATVTATLPRNSVGTAQLRNNAVTSAKVLNGSLLRVDFKAGQLPTGPPGPPGPAGPAGPPGPQGEKGEKGDSPVKLWAAVNSSGSIARSSGTTSAGRLGTGQYEVIFNQDVRSCAYVATLGNPSAQGAVPGEISTAPRSTSDNGVYVATRSSAGPAEDKSFFLAVYC